MNNIINPDTGAILSVFSVEGKALLKQYIKSYQILKNNQSGGAPTPLGEVQSGPSNAGAVAPPNAVGNDTVGASITQPKPVNVADGAVKGNAGSQ